MILSSPNRASVVAVPLLSSPCHRSVRPLCVLFAQVADPQCGDLDLTIVAAIKGGDATIYQPVQVCPYNESARPDT